MRQIKSASGSILHTIICTTGTGTGRYDCTDNDDSMQVAVIRVPMGKVVPAHSHWTYYDKTIQDRCEAWIIIEGRVKTELYDVDGKLLTTTTLCPGDVLVTANGAGHSFHALSHNTIIVECRSGPYNATTNLPPYNVITHG